nr:unnamed protein product [Callosobruchus analis]
MRTILTSRPILNIFNPSLVTELHTDASCLGFGSILIQIDTSGQKRVVAYYSKQTSPEQRKFHSYELETLAVVLSLLVTDCSALRTAFTKKDLVPRIARWWLEVQDFNLTIEHRPGTQMSHVDALSRDLIQDAIELSQRDLSEGEWLLAVQLQDEQVRLIREILQERLVTASTKQYFDNYSLQGGIVFKKLHSGRKVWLVPRRVRRRICRLCHDEMGHFAVKKTPPKD